MLFLDFPKLLEIIIFTEAAPQGCFQEKQLYWNYTSAWVFSCKFAVYFQNTFS